MADPPTRNRTQQEDEIRALKEEVTLLTLASRDDEAEMRQLKTRLSEVEVECGHLRRRVDEQQGKIAAQNKELTTLTQEKLLAENELKNIKRTRETVEDYQRERGLLNQQADIDERAIRDLHTALHEALLERDQLRASIQNAQISRDDASSRVALLEAHAESLRHSNEELSQKVLELTERLDAMEREDLAQWYTRKSKREIAAARGDSAATSAPVTSTPPKQDVLPPMQPKPRPRQDLPPKPCSGVEPLQPSRLDDTIGTTSKSPKSSSNVDVRELVSSHLAVRDAISGDLVQSIPRQSRPHYSDSEDSAPSTPIKSTSPQKAPRAQETKPSPVKYRTVKQMREEAKRSAELLKGSAAMAPHLTPPATTDDPPFQRPGTTPLVVEAIYGEKGSTKEGNKMYLVKYVAVEVEQWTSAAFVPSCPALDDWKAAKERDRQLK